MFRKNGTPGRKSGTGGNKLSDGYGKREKMSENRGFSGGFMHFVEHCGLTCGFKGAFLCMFEKCHIRAWKKAEQGWR